MVNANNSAEADILSKYKDVFPAEFIESVRKGVSWLCTHNNITYQTSIMVASDRVLYNTAGSSVLRLGLINTNAPLTGLTYYEVKSVEVAKDEVSGSIIFNIKAKYDTPMGINVILVPIIYFDPEVAPETYNKSEIDAMIAKLQVAVDGKADAQVTNDVVNGIYDQIEELSKNESLVKLEAKVDDMLQSLALDFVTNEKLDQELAKLESGDKELDLSSYLKVKDAEATYLKVADIATKPELVGPAGKDGTDGKDGTSVTVDEVKPIIIEALKADDDFKQEVKGADGINGTNGTDGAPGKDGVSPTAEEVANVLKDNEEFKASVKGEQGIPGTSANKDDVVAALKADDEFKAAVKGDTPDVSNLATKDELTELTAKVDAKAEKTDLDAYAKTEALDAYAKSDALTDLVSTTKLTEEVAKLATTESLTTGLADKLDTATYTTDKAEFVTNTSLTTTLGEYLKTSEADTKYEPKATE